MKKPLIAHILWSLGRAGAERVVFELARALPEYGYRVVVIAAGGGGPMKKDFEDAGIKIIIGPTTSAFQRGKTVAFLKKQIEELKPAVWHSHLCDVWAEKAVKDLPWVITAHNDDQDDGWIQHKLRGAAFRRADHVVCVSKVVEQYVKKEFKVVPSHLSVIRNGVDFNRLKLRPNKGWHKPFYIMTNGRFAAQKNHETLFKALALLKNRSWELDVPGDGPERAKLQRLAQDLNIASRVHFPGIVSDIPRRLSESDLFCFPSRWEGQGLALLEAAGSKLPIIASDLPVFHEVFNDRSMKFVPAEDVKVWAKAIEWAMNHPSEMKKKADQAFKLVHETFALDRMVRQYVELYENLACK